MIKRKCGSCRFYREAGLAGSGWCEHPQRRTSNEAMVMVRRGELACRNGWSQDLWAAKTADDARGDSASLGVVPPRPLTPATVDEIAALIVPTSLQAADPPAASMGEDVVVGQAAVATPSPEAAMTPARDEEVTAPPVEIEVDERAVLLAQDTRAAIIKARERHRARAAGRPVDPPAHEHDDATEPGAVPLPDHQGGRGAGSRADERPAPVPVDELPLNLGRAAAAPYREDLFDSVPELRPDVELPRARRMPVTLPASEPLPEVSRDERDRAAWAWGDEVAPGARDGDAGNALVHRLEPELSAYDRALERARQLRAAVAAPIEPLVEAEPPPVLPANAVPAMPIPGEAAEREPAKSDRREAAPVDEPDEEPADTLIRVAANVPRVCRTCRDFRPADSGERGWCTNRWAFTHRRMVDADEMPCHTSLGCWWLPHDEVWLASADVREHGQPTPLLDAWLAQREAAEERVPAPLRRRRS